MNNPEHPIPHTTNLLQIYSHTQYEYISFLHFNYLQRDNKSELLLVQLKQDLHQNLYIYMNSKYFMFVRECVGYLGTKWIKMITYI